MNQVLSHYYQRSPRYILLPQENCLVRIAGPKQTPWEEGTEIKNISMTGLCFTAPNILEPQTGECVKIQFEIPGSQTMACHAIVSRIEKIDPETLLVAIEFESLNQVQRKNLFKGLKGKQFKDEGMTIDTDPIPKIPKWMYISFFVSLTLSLFLSAYLLFSLLHFLSDPLWIDKLTSIFQFLLKLW